MWKQKWIHHSFLSKVDKWFDINVFGGAIPHDRVYNIWFMPEEMRRELKLPLTRTVLPQCWEEGKLHAQCSEPGKFISYVHLKNLKKNPDFFWIFFFDLFLDFLCSKNGKKIPYFFLDFLCSKNGKKIRKKILRFFFWIFHHFYYIKKIKKNSRKKSKKTSPKKIRNFFSFFY